MTPPVRESADGYGQRDGDGLSRPLHFSLSVNVTLAFTGTQAALHRQQKMLNGSSVTHTFEFLHVSKLDVM